MSDGTPGDWCGCEWATNPDQCRHPAALASARAWMEKALDLKEALDAVVKLGLRYEHDLAALAGKVKELESQLATATDHLDTAWGVIANAGRGDWTLEHPEWRDAAARWRDRWHDMLGIRQCAPPEQP